MLTQYLLGCKLIKCLEIARELSITRVMLQKWHQEELDIMKSRKGSRKAGKGGTTRGRWHEMEVRLHQKFLMVRELGKPVGKKWFAREGRKIANEMDIVAGCQFSAGWFEGFCTRWRVSWRARTKVSQQAPVDKITAIQAFLQEIRRKSQPISLALASQDTLPSRFLKQFIYNMDQTPLPFEFLQQRTFNTKGATTIYIHSKHTSWTKRQATLMLTACADGSLQCKPILIYHGDIKETRPRLQERLQYHPDVHVLFNRTAYSNEDVTLDWLHRDICQMNAKYCTFLPQPERLITLDIFTGQMTEKTFEAMKTRSIIPVYIPDGCTGYVQPMDTIINKLVKDKISELLGDMLDMMDNNVEVTHETIGQRRVLITHAVAQAWKWLHTEKKDSITKSFEQAGISLCPHGTEDYKLHIRGLPLDSSVVVGDWHLDIDSDEEVEFVGRTEPTSLLHNRAVLSGVDRISISSICN